MKDKKDFRYLKTVVILFILSLVVVVPGLAAAAGNALVGVSTPAGVLEPGEQFIISITVEPNNAIAGMQFDISYDPAIVTVDSITEGNLFNQSGESTYFEQGAIDNVAGTVTGVFGAIIGPGETVTDAGIFAVITMTAGNTGGSSTLTLSNVIIGDVQGNSVAVNLTAGTATVNQPPVLNSIGNKTLDEGENYSFIISATDPDGDVLVYSVSAMPGGASLDPATRTFSWTPSYRQAGSYSSVHFTVSDGNESDTEAIAITVNNVYQTDLNNDGAVNVLDIISVAQHWSEAGVNGWITEDINENGTINVLDVILIGQDWTG